MPARSRDGSPGDVLTRPAPRPDLVLRWAAHDDGLADVWLPPAVGDADVGAAPPLVALHGGFWRQAYDRRHLRPLAAALAERGWAVVVPEYARAGGRHLAAGVDAPWPLLAEDLRTVRRVLPALLAEVAPGRVAARAPVLVGHSAGGHLALWWALDAGPGERFGRPRHVLALAPVADLPRADAERLGDAAVPALLGGPPGEVPERLAEADVAARLRSGGARPGGCRLVVLHGEQDQQVPAAHSAALAADVPALEVRVLPGVEHFALIDPLSTAWSAVLAALPRPTDPGHSAT